MRLRSSLLAALSGLAIAVSPAYAGLATSAAGRWSYVRYAPHVERWTVDAEGWVHYVPMGAGQMTVPTGSMPEPVSMSVVATGLAGLGLSGARRRKKPSD